MGPASADARGESAPLSPETRRTNELARLPERLPEGLPPAANCSFRGGPIDAPGSRLDFLEPAPSGSGGRGPEGRGSERAAAPSSTPPEDAANNEAALGTFGVELFPPGEGILALLWSPVDFGPKEEACGRDLARCRPVVGEAVEGLRLLGVTPEAGGSEEFLGGVTLGGRARV